MRATRLGNVLALQAPRLFRGQEPCQGCAQSCPGCHLGRVEAHGGAGHHTVASWRTRCVPPAVLRPLAPPTTTEGSG